MAADDIERAEAQQARRFHLRTGQQDAAGRSDHAEILHPQRQRDAHVQGPESPRCKGGQQQHQQQPRQGQHGIGQRRQHALGPAAAPGRQQADEAARDGRREHAQQRQRQGQPRPMRQPRQHAAPQLIEAQRLGQAGRFQVARQLLAGRIGIDDKR
ncbi:conserved hypothetical protein, partial [Ricinus communis]